MRTISVTTTLAASADTVWTAVKTPQAFLYVTKGVLRYPAAATIGRPWQVGDDIEGWTFLLGVIPLSKHRLTVASIDEDGRALRTNEGGGMVRSWNHLLAVTPIDETSCSYEDRIDIDAGLFTPLVALFAAGFYRYRQWRWSGLARLLAATR